MWDGVLSEPGTNYLVVHNDTGAPVDVSCRRKRGFGHDDHRATPTCQTRSAVTPPPQGPAISGKIAFVDSEGGNIYTVNGDGTNLEQLTTGLDPQWNHAGTQIAFARQGPTPGIYVINADGTGERLLHQTNEPRAPIGVPTIRKLCFPFRAPPRAASSTALLSAGINFVFPPRKICCGIWEW